jgi:hypothetical protein
LPWRMNAPQWVVSWCARRPACSCGCWEPQRRLCRAQGSRLGTPLRLPGGGVLWEPASAVGRRRSARMKRQEVQLIGLRAASGTCRASVVGSNLHPVLCPHPKPPPRHAADQHTRSPPARRSLLAARALSIAHRTTHTSRDALAPPSGGLTETEPAGLSGSLWRHGPPQQRQ